MTAWVDLGGGEATAASLVDELAVMPPMPPSLLTVRPLVEQLSWTVRVRHHRCMVQVIGCHHDEAGARSHARRIVALMHEAACG